MIDVRTLGAIGDGLSLDTTPIQKAFNLGSTQKETVFLPPGSYRVGTLCLKSNLDIELAEGARIVASREIEDYVEDTRFECGKFRHYLLWGQHIQNVTIHGKGVIDGSGPAYWLDEYESGARISDPIEFGPLHRDFLKPKDARPCLLYCEESSQLRLEGITFIDSPAYTVWWIGCTNCIVEKVTVRNPRNAPNTDTFVIDCCNTVIIHHCDILSGDDCIALKSDTFRLGRQMTCENIQVEDCRLTSSAAAVRIGYEGDAVIRDSSFKRLTIYSACHGINVTSVAHDECSFTQIITGAPIENILVEDITMENVASAIYIWAGNIKNATTYAASISGITFRNISATTVDGSYIGARDNYPIQEIQFENVAINLQRELPSPSADFLPDAFVQTGLGACMTLRNINNITLGNCSFTGFSTSPKLICKNVSGILDC